MVTVSDNQPIISFESLIPDSLKNKPVVDKNTETDSESDSGVRNDTPRGKCKSGKFWKTKKTRAKTMIKTKGLQLSYDKRKKMQEEIKLAKQLTRNALDERKKQKEELRERRKTNIKRRQENERKAEIVQVVKNPSKIKKKHLRMIEKRDTLPFQNKKVD
ncbi:coiled-coil domain-containing protein 86 [Macrosteles quadrilineatus]|uniref:coiled-coil domain-containing protein 86 n=1 Tax=Macrosteles quadrilineatus TaxID=74068 RepID=UPI0023E29269|nr:coiled-coil domain-containing protein 86 [Macrosteles quadrilineatus]